MCTAATYQTKDFYFGRTLDHTFSYSEEVTLTPRNFPLKFRHSETLDNHFAVLGMAHVLEDYPLYFDAMNEKGLAMAGLNFVGYASYKKPEKEKKNIAQFEIIPWILGQCATVAEVKELMKDVCITDTPFREDMPPAQLHWIIADHDEAITMEAVEEGIRIYDNPVGVLTNNPSFPEQLFQLNNYMGLTSAAPENRFSSRLKLQHYSYGMGAMGLPGDWSSQSRFVRASYVKEHSVSGASESESVGQMFHILGAVNQVRGCSETQEGKSEITVYISCCNTDKGIYYYTSYSNHQISAVNMHREKLDDIFLVRYPLILEEKIHMQN